MHVESPAPPETITLKQFFLDKLDREAMLARKTLARWVVGRLSDTVLLVLPDEADAVIEELRRMGQTPRVVR